MPSRDDEHRIVEQIEDRIEFVRRHRSGPSTQVRLFRNFPTAAAGTHEPGQIFALDTGEGRDTPNEWYPADQVISIVGETSCYNGLEIDDDGPIGIPGGINYRFCSVCGSSVYFDMIYPPVGKRFFTIALGAFVEPFFPPPTVEFFTNTRHPWVPAIPGAQQIVDPLGADAGQAWRASDPRGRAKDT